MKKLIRIAAVTAAFAGFAVPGVVAAQTATVSTEGPNSPAHVRVENELKNRVETHNDLRAKANNYQSAETGNAKVANNTTVGDVGTGNAAADNATYVGAWIDNSTADTSCGCLTASEPSADVSTQGPNSPVKVSVENEIYNSVEISNHVSLETNNKQHVESGDASAYNNTTVGNVTTGDATASNASTIELSITN